jgi:hypothetical protein
MKTSLKWALAAGLTMAGIGYSASSASALPISGLDPAIATSSDVAQNVDKVWWCGYYGCHRGWGYRRWGYWHRPYYRWHRWGYWHRPYWHRWGWRRW